MNILIVDDATDLVALAKRWLEREGHGVDDPRQRASASPAGDGGERVRRSPRRH
ncbi:MAG TPA: hypothetical protein VFB93_05160 [Burkholderiales bacterium]|nr:hypothetical protein [Burkholderiales bacterium]